MFKLLNPGHPSGRTLDKMSVKPDVPLEGFTIDRFQYVVQKWDMITKTISGLEGLSTLVGIHSLRGRWPSGLVGFSP